MKNIVTYADASQLYTAEQIAQFEREGKEKSHKAEIENSKALLSATDYKVTKNAECFALGLELPYNAEELHKERQALRDRINELEKEL